MKPIVITQVNNNGSGELAYLTRAFAVLSNNMWNWRMLQTKVTIISDPFECQHTRLKDFKIHDAKVPLFMSVNSFRNSA